MPIPDGFKDELKQQAQLIDIVSQFTSVKKVGQHHMAICPFHEDQHPSMILYEDTQTFSCFSCGAGSRNHMTIQTPDVYGFLKGILNCNFQEAIVWLAHHLHVPIPDLDPKLKQKLEMKEKWHQYCKNASDRFYKKLLQTNEALRYLNDRGITQSDIYAWQLGLGDDQDKEFCNTNQRIAFPFFDENGEIISFTGRTMLTDHDLKEKNKLRKEKNQMPIVKYQDRFPVAKDHPKYQLHPYPTFEKGQHLYGLHVAKEVIRQKKSVIIVEGWLDVISLHRAGIVNSVSTMGLSFTDAHAQKLKRLGAKHVIIMRDSDQAGMAAIHRNAKTILQNDMIPYVIQLPNGMDPHDYMVHFEKFNPELVLFKQLESLTKKYTLFAIDSIHEQYEQEISEMTMQLSELKQKRLTDWISLLNVYQQSNDFFSMQDYLHEHYHVNLEFLQTKIKRNVS